MVFIMTQDLCRSLLALLVASEEGDECFSLVGVVWRAAKILCACETHSCSESRLECKYIT